MSFPAAGKLPSSGPSQLRLTATIPSPRQHPATGGSQPCIPEWSRTDRDLSPKCLHSEAHSLSCELLRSAGGYAEAEAAQLEAAQLREAMSQGNCDLDGAQDADVMAASMLQLQALGCTGLGITLADLKHRCQPITDALSPPPTQGRPLAGKPSLAGIAFTNCKCMLVL